MRLAAIAIVSMLGCRGSSDGADKHEPAPAPTDKPIVGRIVDYVCEVTGDYVQLEILEAVRAEAPAWQACVDRVVKKDETTTHVTKGEFAFDWTLKAGKPVDIRRHSAGQGMSCIEPIIQRLQGTPAFSKNRVSGTLSCSVKFDDSR